MVKKGYPPSYAAAVTASAAPIGALIPPSVFMIIYGYLVGLSTGKLFMAGAIPGVLVGLVLMGVAYVRAVQLGIGKNHDAPKRTWTGFLAALRESGPALSIPVIILGGIVGGFFTPTEAGVVASVTVLFLGTFVYRNFTWSKLREAFLSAAYTTSMVMLILATSTMFANLLTRARFQTTLIDFMQSLTPSPSLQIVMIVGFLLFLGCFIDCTAILVMFAVPLAAVGSGLGFDPIHFGTTIVVACLIGGVTPPVGTLLFITAGIAKINLAEASRGVWPFVAALVLVNLLVAYIPFLSTFLPKLAFGD
jgi:C4-dicarboxylate transporter DctM subunit